MKAAVLVAAFAAGVWVDVHSDLPGQIAASVGCWALLLWLLGAARGDERRAMLACLAIATAGEIVLSLGAGLYAYRLGNIPHFVPPGHVFLYVLGVALARRLGDVPVVCIYAAAGTYAVAAAFAQIDTLAVPLVVLLAGCAWLHPAQRRLYAATFVLALPLELYGTWMGSWTWQRELPGLGLSTTNPPAAAGAFYAALDALVALAAGLAAARGGRRTNLAASG